MKTVKFILALSLVLTTSFAIAQTARPAKPAAKAASAQPVAPSGQVALKVVANVNGQELSRQQLIEVCLDDYGKEVLERLVSRFVLEAACQKKGVTVTQDDIRAEVEETAARFSIPTDQYLKLLENERGISPKVYVTDIVWPTVAVRKLVGDSVAVADAELQVEYERQYGEAYKIRMIACKTRDEALKVRELAVKTPDEFASLAQQYSTDPYSASLGGAVPPLRRHVNDPKFEKQLFAMKPGDISEPIQVADMYLIVLVEEIMPSDPAITFDSVKEELKAILMQSKTRDAATAMSKKILSECKVVMVYTDPARRQANPGVAATIDGKVISTAVLGEECLSRHGKEALKGLINRTLIEQAVKAKNIAITPEDEAKKLDEIALENLPPKADGTPDVEQWLNIVEQRYGASKEKYTKDVLWLTVALERLSAGRFEISEEDLQRGYEANFGVKVRCRAIVLNDLRTAQKVWAMAREKGSEEAFIELAKKYSADPQSQATGGEVPPIAKYSGQPTLEEAAFKLEKGELSQIISVDNVFVILLCTGQTEPIGVDFEEVKENIVRDITAKKQNVAMTEIFQELTDAAAVENYLEGTVKNPKGAEPPASSLEAAPMK